MKVRCFYLMLILCISTSAIPVVIMTIDKTNLVNDDKPEDLKTLFKTEDSFYINGECVSRRIFYDDIGKCKES